jgi:hypothetical protein
MEKVKKAPSPELGMKWIEKIRAAGEREDEFLKSAAKTEAIYLHKAKDGAHLFSFNILHSNVETIVPAIYSATPKPDIRRRFNDTTALQTQADPNDPMAAQMAQMRAEQDKTHREAAQMIERAIIVQTDDGALDAEMEMLAGASFTAGRGLIRVRLVEEELEPTRKMSAPPKSRRRRSLASRLRTKVRVRSKRPPCRG